ncbi:hypothetical protein ACIQ6K_08305 [Streptomyces sp. NPDC096354]|uniref:hypothetical protein n=1 Tax=Streptomyces sp. NPDC096354 TaxID=3366088 RepID=UPI00380E5C38
MDRITDMAAEHLRSAHGADLGLAQHENESFRMGRLIVLPVVAVILIALFVHLRS